MQTLTGFIYLWMNSVNGKQYLGSHIGSPDDGYQGSGVAFKRAVAKYGIKSFSRTILELEVAADQIRIREQFYLDQYDAANRRDFYNLKSIAGGGFDYINNHPDRLLMQEKAKVGFQAYLQENGHPKGMLGKSHSAETKELVRIKNRQALAKLKGRPVYQFDKSGTLVASFGTIAEGARSVNGRSSNIKYTCDGKFKTAYGYRWSWTKVPPEF
jgi:group I intron endonuclease